MIHTPAIDGNTAPAAKMASAAVMPLSKPETTFMPES